MRVLLLSLDFDKENAVVLQKTLRDQNKTVSIRILKSDWKNSLFSEIEEFEHIVIIYNPLLEKMGWFYFAAGWILGRRSPGLLYFPQEGELPPLFASLPLAKSTLEVNDYFQREGDLWHQKKRRESSEDALKELGYSFNPDAYAFAVTQGDATAFDLYLSGGLSPDTTDGRGTPIICLAARNRHARLVALLIDAGVNIEAKSQDRENTALMDAASYGDSEVCNLLVNAGAELDHSSKNGQTALMLAIGQKSVESSKILIEAGANPQLKDKLGMTACQYAKLFKMTETISLCEEAMCCWEEDDDS